MITLFSDCDEYDICGCATADVDLHCMYCCKPPARHVAAALDPFLSAAWAEVDHKRRVAAAVGRALPPDDTDR